MHFKFIDPPLALDFDGNSEDLKILFGGLRQLAYGWPLDDDLPEPPDPGEAMPTEEEPEIEAIIQKLPDTAHIDSLAAKFTDDDIKQAKAKANALMTRFVPFTLKDLIPDDKKNTHLYRNNKWVYLLEAWLEGVQVDRVTEDKQVTFYPFYYENSVKVIASHPGKAPPTIIGGVKWRPQQAPVDASA